MLPLIGLVLMGVMLVACFRGSGCMGRRRSSSREPSDLQRELESLKEDVRKLQRQPR